MGGRSLSYKALRHGYYWPIIKKDFADFVRKCDKCQRFSKTTHQPPLAKAQKKFLIVAYEYFTKWVEAKAVATITQKSVEKFLWENIIC